MSEAARKLVPEAPPAPTERLPAGGRAFLVAPARKLDISAAQKWGPLGTFIERHPPSPFATDVFELAVEQAIRDQHFHPERDALILAGHQAQVFMAFWVILRRFQMVRVLIFDDRRSCYRHRLLGSRGCPEGLEQAMMPTADTARRAS